jgi:hypothetical protein
MTALLYFKEDRLLKIWSSKDKYIQIPIQNGKMKVVFNKWHFCLVTWGPEIKLRAYTFEIWKF